MLAAAAGRLLRQPLIEAGSREISTDWPFATSKGRLHLTTYGPIGDTRVAHYVPMMVVQLRMNRTRNCIDDTERLSSDSVFIKSERKHSRIRNERRKQKVLRDM